MFLFIEPELCAQYHCLGLFAYESKIFIACMNRKSTFRVSRRTLGAEAFMRGSRFRYSCRNRRKLLLIRALEARQEVSFRGQVKKVADQ